MTERFKLLSELGRGGMGVVWKARDEETGQIVALKLLREAYADDPDYLGRFERELELAKRVHSDHVVQVLGYGVRKKVPYLALEYVDGPSLRDLIASHGPYNWDETRALLIQIATGLADAHAAGVIHRDVKPSNVLLTPDGTAKLTDFGIARGLDLTRVTATSTLLGTPAYLPPEGPEDERSDLYSLGVIGYELLTGVPPFEGKTYQTVLLAHLRTPPDLTRLPAEAQPILGWLLAKGPPDRPSSASELRSVLQGIASVPAQPATPILVSALQPVATPPVSEPSARQAIAEGGLGILICLLVVAVALAVRFLTVAPGSTAGPVSAPTVTSLRSPSLSPAPVSGPSFYKYAVKLGDSAVTIAVKFNVTLAELVVANPQVADWDHLEIGQVINIPPDGYEVATPTPTPRPTPTLKVPDFGS